MCQHRFHPSSGDGAQRCGLHVARGVETVSQHSPVAQLPFDWTAFCWLRSWRPSATLPTHAQKLLPVSQKLQKALRAFSPLLYPMHNNKNKSYHLRLSVSVSTLPKTKACQHNFPSVNPVNYSHPWHINVLDISFLGFVRIEQVHNENTPLQFF